MREYRLFDIHHAVLATMLSLPEFYLELRRTQPVLNRKNLGRAALPGALGIAMMRVACEQPSSPQCENSTQRAARRILYLQSGMPPRPRTRWGNQTVRELDKDRVGLGECGQTGMDAASIRMTDADDG